MGLFIQELRETLAGKSLGVKDTLVLGLSNADKAFVQLECGRPCEKLGCPWSRRLK